jgi:rubrerythrin
MATWSTWSRSAIPATDKPIGRTKLNLAAAVAGETHEYTDMYPGMAEDRAHRRLHRDRRLVRDAGQGGALARQPLPEGARSVSGVMPQIQPDSLLSLEAYDRERDAYRSRSIARKKLRTVHVGEHVTLLFEDEHTIRYLVQELLRLERIFERESIRESLRSTTRWSRTAATGKRPCSSSIRTRLSGACGWRN